MLQLKPFTRGSWSVDHATSRFLTFYLHCACGFVTQILAHMLDSLVRVSRRVNYGHFVNFLSSHHPLPASGAVIIDTTCCLKDELQPDPGWGARSEISILNNPRDAPKRTPERPPQRHLTHRMLKLTNQHAQCQTRKHEWQGAQRYHWPQSVPSQQFQVLFNSLFKVLFIFPSRYLFAIGLSPLFSFRRNLPPN